MAEQDQPCPSCPISLPLSRRWLLHAWQGRAWHALISAVIYLSLKLQFIRSRSRSAAAGGRSICRSGPCVWTEQVLAWTGIRGPGHGCRFVSVGDNVVVRLRFADDGFACVRWSDLRKGDGLDWKRGCRRLAGIMHMCARGGVFQSPPSSPPTRVLSRLSRSSGHRRRWLMNQLLT